MPAPEIVPATALHAAFLADRLRAADQAELAALATSPAVALDIGRRLSPRSYCALIDGKPAAMFGIARMCCLSGVGHPWFLGTPAVDVNARAMVERNRAWLRAEREPYRALRNHVHARNGRAIRWLRWLGFEVLPAVPYGLLREPFHPFEMRRRECARSSP